MKKYLTDEVKRVIGVAIFVRGIAVPYFGIKQDISLINKDILMIKENHLSHMEGYSKELVKLSELQSKQQDMLLKLMEAVAKIK